MWPGIVFWLPMCDPFHNRSRSPAVNRKPSISKAYLKPGRSRRSGTVVNSNFQFALASDPMSQLVTALVIVCHSSILFHTNGLIPAVNQVDDQLDHGLFICRMALCDHQCDGHQCVVGNPLGAVFAIKGTVFLHKPEK